MGTITEQRDTNRLDVFGGNAEFVILGGKGSTSAQRARIVNWSRGGLLIKLPNPQRKMMLFKQAPVLEEGDRVHLTLRLPPAYREIVVLGFVAHARRPKRSPNTLFAGIEFDVEDPGFEDALRSMTGLLEPRNRSGRMRRQRSA